MKRLKLERRLSRTVVKIYMEELMNNQNLSEDQAGEMLIQRIKEEIEATK